MGDGVRLAVVPRVDGGEEVAPRFEERGELVEEFAARGWVHGFPSGGGEGGAGGGDGGGDVGGGGGVDGGDFFFGSAWGVVVRKRVFELQGVGGAYAGSTVVIFLPEVEGTNSLLMNRPSGCVYLSPLGAVSSV